MDGLDTAQCGPVRLRPAEWELVLGILRSKVPERDVWAFGSRAQGTAKPFSDLDLGLDGLQPLTLAREAELAEAFEESDLPFRVDLVDLVLAARPFGERVRRTGIKIQQGHAPHVDL